MNFRDAQSRLLNDLRQRIHNGDLTERGLARMTGVSQPHIHNVLKRVRNLSPQVFDSILIVLNHSLLDLFSIPELEREIQGRSRPHMVCEVPMLRGSIGPNMPWPGGTVARETHFVQSPISCSPEHLVLARLMPDPRMSILDDTDLATLDVSEPARTCLSPYGVYAIERSGEAILRYLRYGTKCIYMADSDSLNRPSGWEPVGLPAPGVLGIVKGHVIWVGREKEGYLLPRQRGRLLDEATSS